MKANENNYINSEKDTKRIAILNAAITEFCKGYEAGSTYAIIKTAGVSKGLLFHHFGTKKDLFLETFDYAVGIVMNEFYNLMNFKQRDVLERWKQGALLKMDLMKEHPGIFDFLSLAVLTDNVEVKTEIVKRCNNFACDTIPKLYYDDIDRSLFRDDIDVETAIKVIHYTIEGFAQSEADKGKSTKDYYAEYERLLNDLDSYILLFKKTFYK